MTRPITGPCAQPLLRVVIADGDADTRSMYRVGASAAAARRRRSGRRSRRAGPVPHRAACVADRGHPAVGKLSTATPCVSCCAGMERRERCRS